MRQRDGSRRWPVGRLVALGVVAVVALLARPASGQTGDGLLPPHDWTDEQEQQLLDLIDRTEQGLAQFSDVDAIGALGFHDFGISAPGGYDHYINLGWIDDGHILDPNHPEALVYQTTWDEETGEPTGTQLVAAMYFLPWEYDGSNVPDEYKWMPGWHVHPEVCVTDDLRFAGLTSPGEPCTSGHPFEGPPMLHVWIVDNECDHRFGEIGVGGVECDVHWGPHDPHDPGHGSSTTQPGHHGSTTTQPGHDGHGSTTTTASHGHGTAQPARPVPRQPNFTG